MTWLLRKNNSVFSSSPKSHRRSPEVRDCREVHADGDLEEEEGEEGDDGVDVGGARPGCEAADRHCGGDHQQAVLEMVVIAMVMKIKTTMTMKMTVCGGNTYGGFTYR